MGLARALFSREVLELLWNAAPDRLDGLIVQTAGELDVPWEVVHLVPPAGVADDGRPRFLSAYGLTRWVYDTAHPTELHVDSGRVRYVCPEYAEQTLHLTHTAEERRFLEERFAATTVDPDDADGITALMHDGFDLLHFAGHGRWNDASPQAQELLLAGFRAQEEVPRARYSDDELRHDLPDVGSADAAAAGPFVFLNACDIGRLPSGPASLGGFPEAFLRGGAAAFVGCSWAVGDDPAATFVEAFYRALAEDDATIADATRAARRAAREEADLSELAYAVYAHPHARMRIDRPALDRPVPEGPPS
jgi:CHAT domain-containing protein